MTIRLNRHEVARAYREGDVSLKECGEMFGCSNMTIQRALKRMGVPRKVGGDRGTPRGSNGKFVQKHTLSTSNQTGRE